MILLRESGSISAAQSQLKGEAVSSVGVDLVVTSAAILISPRSEFGVEIVRDLSRSISDDELVLGRTMRGCFVKAATTQRGSVGNVSTGETKRK